MGPERSAPDSYWVVLEPYWAAVDIYGAPEIFLASFRLVPPVIRDLYAAHFCESEVSNGGLHQFFMNSTGVLAPEAVEAFRHLGFNETARIVTEAMGFFGEPYPRDQAERQARLQAVEGEERSEWDPFFSLDDRFYESLGPEHTALFDALDSHARSSA